MFSPFPQQFSEIWWICWSWKHQIQLKFINVFYSFTVDVKSDKSAKWEEALKVLDSQTCTIKKNKTVLHEQLTVSHSQRCCADSFAIFVHSTTFVRVCFSSRHFVNLEIQVTCDAASYQVRRLKWIHTADLSSATQMISYCLWSHLVTHL